MFAILVRLDLLVGSGMHAYHLDCSLHLARLRLKLVRDLAREGETRASMSKPLA